MKKLNKKASHLDWLFVYIVVENEVLGKSTPGPWRWEIDWKFIHDRGGVKFFKIHNKTDIIFRFNSPWVTSWRHGEHSSLGRNTRRWLLSVSDLSAPKASGAPCRQSTALFLLVRESFNTFGLTSLRRGKCFRSCLEFVLEAINFFESWNHEFSKIMESLELRWLLILRTKWSLQIWSMNSTTKCPTIVQGESMSSLCQKSIHFSISSRNSLSKMRQSQPSLRMKMRNRKKRLFNLFFYFNPNKTGLIWSVYTSRGHFPGSSTEQWRTNCSLRSRRQHRDCVRLTSLIQLLVLGLAIWVPTAAFFLIQIRRT